jgi:large conductance mechanosensitive channel
MAHEKLTKKAVKQAVKEDESVKAAVRHAERAERRASEAEEQIERLKRTVAKTRKSLVGKQFHGFLDFLREQSVVGLAIGLVLGTQAKAVVDQMIASFFNPLIGLLLPGEGTLKEKTFTLTIGPKSETFGWGAFVITLITFVIVAAVVYFVFKGLGLDKLDKKKE